MEAENSLDDFNRTKCSRSRFQSTSSSEKKLSDTRRSRSRSRFRSRSRSPPEKKLSDTRRSRSRFRSRFRSRYPPEKKLSDTRYKDEKKSEKKSKKKLSDTRYKEEKKSSSSDDEEFYFPSGHKRCHHGITRKDLKPFNKYFKQLRDSEGYEVPFCPSFCVYVRVFRCDVDEEQEFFNETCRKCIAEYNKKTY